MKAGPGTIVTVTYDLITSTGQRMDSTAGVGKLNLLFKQTQGIPGLAATLRGKKAGEAFEANMPAATAFGERTPALIETYHRSRFPADKSLALGEVLVINDVKKQQLKTALITAIEGEFITLDFHHPMAGQSMVIKGMLHRVRRARSSELKAFQPYMETEEEGEGES